MKTEFPVLYSFRRCPYAMRARLAIKVSNVQVELREVLLADKPEEMLACSAKGTVPVLQLPDGRVIDESLDIMHWALEQHDPDNWLTDDIPRQAEIDRLITLNDTEFKQHLDHYKYADRFPDHAMSFYRQQGEEFLKLLEEKLNQHAYLTGNTISLADMALLPFIRQFAHVDKTWFYQTPYKKLQAWLEHFLKDEVFLAVMKKYSRWQPGETVQYFP